VLLACGHDGTEQPDGVPARSGEGLPANCAFHPERDLRVADLTRLVAEQLREQTGEAPYVVIAAFHRKYIDANRSEACAFETAAARAYYQEYHAVLRGFVDEIRAENDGLGLLLDLHGATRQADAPVDIYVGTENGRTIAALRHGTSDDALYRRRGLVGLLQAAGYAMLPGQFREREHPAFTGGYTVGSHHSGGIDAIQLEIVAELRKPASCRARLATDLTNAIASLLPRWLPSPPRRRTRRDRRRRPLVAPAPATPSPV
jgi:N-formylglutamate amidohydrolase